MAVGDFIAQSFQHLGMVFLFHAPKIIFFYVIFVIWFSNRFQLQKGNLLRHALTLFATIFISAALDFAFINSDSDGYKNIWLAIYDIAMTACFAYLSFFSSPARMPVRRSKTIKQEHDSALPIETLIPKVELSDEEKLSKIQEKLSTEVRNSQKMLSTDGTGLSLQELISQKLYKVVQKDNDFLIYFVNGNVGLQNGLDLKVFPNEVDCFSALGSLHRLKYLPYGALTSIPLSELFYSDQSDLDN